MNSRLPSNVHESCRPSLRRDNPRLGLTLVELMVAIALSAVLLGSLVGILGGVTKQAKIVERLDQPVWPARFLKLIRRDLLAADAIWQTKGVVWMRTDPPTYMSYRSRRSRDPAANESSMGLRDIGYLCQSGSQRMLVRRDRSHHAVLAIGPSRIVVERLDESGTPQPLPPSPGPVPDQVRIWIWQNDDTAPIMVRDLVVR